MTTTDNRTKVGSWTVVWDGGGTVAPGPDAHKTLALAPAAATAPSITHSALVVSDAVFADTALTMTLRTMRHLRTGSPPNPWEVAWAIWHYTDHQHFYYLILKPNGWELGKADPAYPGAQRFLCTGSEPTYPIGPWYRVDVDQTGASITVAGDGHRLTTFVDDERPYLEGSIALYCEDAAAEFAEVTSAGIASGRFVLRAAPHRRTAKAVPVTQNAATPEMTVITPMGTLPDPAGRSSATRPARHRLPGSRP